MKTPARTRRSRTRRWAYVVPLAAAAGVGMAACSSSPSASVAGGSSGQLTTINMTLAPVVDGAPVYYAIKSGLFAKEGLKVNAKQAVAGGPALVPTLLSGSIQLGGTGLGTAIPAWSEKVPIEVVTPLTLEGTDNTNSQEHIIALASSHVTTAADLAGKTIAVPTLDNMGQIQVSSFLTAHGVDPSSVKYIAVPYPQQEAALAANRIQIAFTTEPYLNTIEGAMPVTDLGATAPTVAPSIPDFFVIGTTSYVSSHQAIIRKFQLAVQQAITYLAGNPAAARNLVPSFTSISAANAQKIIMPVFSNDEKLASSQQVADDALKYGVIKTPITVKNYFIQYPLPS
jgi:NitT/TauT family transport system substrate-binding protein